MVQSIPRSSKMEDTMQLKWIAVLGFGFVAIQAIAMEPQSLTTKKEKTSYTIGVDTGRNLRELEAEVDLDLLMQGIKHGLSGEKLLITEKELFATRNGIQLEMRRKKAEKRMKQLLKTDQPDAKNKPEEDVTAEEKH